MTGNADTENAALETALTGYSDTQRQSALDCIAGNRYREYTETPAGGDATAWMVYSRTSPRKFYVVVDDGDALWCPCPAHGKCWHHVVAIMLRVHAEHTELRHTAWCAGNPQQARKPNRENYVCCPADIRDATSGYDPFAVFDRL